VTVGAGIDVSVPVIVSVYEFSVLCVAEAEIVGVTEPLFVFLGVIDVEGVPETDRVIFKEPLTVAV